VTSRGMAERAIARSISFAITKSASLLVRGRAERDLKDRKRQSDTL
jgi:hypothetical protein